MVVLNFPDMADKYAAPGDQLTIEGEIQARGATIQVRNFDSATLSFERVIAWPDYALTRSLGPVSYSANTGASRFAGFGEIFLAPAGVPLKYKGLGGPYRHISCRFDASTFESLTGIAGWDDGMLEACRNIRAPQVGAAMMRMAQETLIPSFASDMLADALANVILIDLARYLRHSTAEAKRAKGGLAPWQLRRIEEHVRESLASTLSIGALAALCGISSGHLMRAFKQTTGETVHGYVERMRLTRAQQLLSETEMPLKSIAVELGFSTPSSFSFAFRRATGGTPAGYREQLRRATSRAALRAKSG